MPEPILLKHECHASLGCNGHRLLGSAFGTKEERGFAALKPLVQIQLHSKRAILPMATGIRTVIPTPCVATIAMHLELHARVVTQEPEPFVQATASLSVMLLWNMFPKSLKQSLGELRIVELLRTSGINFCRPPPTLTSAGS
eukprot:CAMPEP_0175891644 /NCGR_PEP_ID=MMETSP0107_2-20121207/48492_1 /TAXON_ID=195067 ORGANISM="Goniomonas pacifica, Strain CCMP1869" /NCGR_SAMPLE_ID=MMETSP0107_2 /ASSEMBLY_ACC=CAM_ASM_000203 /LENGTH=141 /DNA_ID=CAMNT_0017212531 /DNA_START=142 /DNA_END=567 /DNA_ORIENTATION=+